MALVREIGFAQSFSFKYSSRPGTPAAGARKQISESVKSERLAALQALLMSQQDDANRASIGLVRAVLFEKLGREPGQLVGRTPQLQPVHAAAPASLIGQIRDVKLEILTANSLGGRLRESAFA